MRLLTAALFLSAACLAARADFGGIPEAPPPPPGAEFRDAPPEEGEDGGPATRGADAAEREPPAPAPGRSADPAQARPEAPETPEEAERTLPAQPARKAGIPVPALDGAEALLRRNPFGNGPAAKPGKDAKSGASLQLTSVCCIDGRWNFVVTDTDSKASYALPLKGGITEELQYRVDFFDEDTMSVSVSNSVAEYVLTLKTPDEPAAAAQAAAPDAAKKAQQQQQASRQNYNNFRPWFPPPRVEIPTPKRINRR